MKRQFLISAFLFVFAVPLLAGVTYDFKSATSGPGGTTLAGNAAVEGKNMRIEFQTGDEMMFKSGSVLISHDGGRNFFVLNTKEKTCYEFSLQQLLETAGNILKAMGGMVQMSVTNQKVNVTDAGEGEAIEGYPTRKYVVNSSYELSMKILGSTTTSRVETVTETWATPRLPIEYMTFVQQKGLRTGFEELDKLIEAQSGNVKGFPLRQVMTTKSTSGKKSETSVTTTTISNIKAAMIPAARFEVPADYTRLEAPTLGIPGMPKID